MEMGKELQHLTTKSGSGQPGEEKVQGDLIHVYKPGRRK